MWGRSRKPNTLAMNALCMTLSLEAEYLEPERRERCVSLGKRHLPSDVDADPQSRRLAFCEWLAHHPVTVDPRELQISYAALPASTPWEELPKHIPGVLVGIAEDRLLHWSYQDLYDHAPLMLVTETLNGLFGFVQSIVWPRWVNSLAMHRLLGEHDVPTTATAAVERFRDCEARLRKLKRADVHALLRDNLFARLLYEAGEREDAAALRRLGWKWVLSSAGMTPRLLSEYLGFIQSGNREMVEQRKRHLRYMVIMTLAAKRMARGEPWRSQAFENAVKACEDARKRLQDEAERHYASEFLAFATQPAVIEAEQALFAGTRHAGSRPYAALVEQLAFERRPLPLELQLR